jgi:hypothetical protein
MDNAESAYPAYQNPRDSSEVVFILREKNTTSVPPLLLPSFLQDLEVGLLPIYVTKLCLY